MHLSHHAYLLLTVAGFCGGMLSLAVIIGLIKSSAPAEEPQQTERQTNA